MQSSVYFASARARSPNENKLNRIQSLFEAADLDGVIRKGDLTALKVHFGEVGNDSYINPVLIKPIANKVKALGARPSLVIFASRHKSASNMRTLTIHPIGNFARAEMGGKDRTLVPAAPHEMTMALKELVKRAGGLKYQVSLEATHHGPYLQTPTFYIEIGSDEEAWREPEPASVIAETIFSVLTSEIPQHEIALGVGGGHYVPRITDVARQKKISFGHMLPSYAFEEGLWHDMLENMLRATPGATMVYFHRKAIKTPVLREMEAWFRERGIQPVSSKDLEDMAPNAH